MTTSETFQISPEQAEIYEARFVPALFAEWAPALVEAAGLEPGQSVLDVACGTGIVTRTAADRVGPTGALTGLDLNEAMLTVARGLRPDITWRQGDVAALPFADGAFDAVLCQSALMFFPDATGALREMGRVCKSGGVVGVQVFSTLDEQPAYGPWIEMVAGHVGPDAINLLGTYWVHGDLEQLSGRFSDAGLGAPNVTTRTGTARFGSIDEFVLTEISSTPLIDRITDEQQERILADSRDVLARFAGPGVVELPLAGHLVVARKR